MTELTAYEFKQELTRRGEAMVGDDRFYRLGFIGAYNFLIGIFASDLDARSFGLNGVDFTALTILQFVLETEEDLEDPNFETGIYFASSSESACRWEGDPGYIREGFMMYYPTKYEGEEVLYYAHMTDEVFVKYLWLLRNKFATRKESLVYMDYQPAPAEELAEYDAAINAFCERKGILLNDDGFDYYDVRNNCRLFYVKQERSQNPFLGNDFLAALNERKRQIDAAAKEEDSE